MEITPDGSLRLEQAVSMSRLSDAELCPDAAEIARLVQLTLGGDAAAFGKDSRPPLPLPIIWGLPLT